MSFYGQAEGCSPRRAMCLGTEAIRMRLGIAVPIILVVGNVQSKVSDACAVQTFVLFIRLRVVGRCGKFLPREERTRSWKAFIHKLGPIVEYQVVGYSIWDTSMAKEYEH